MRKFQDVSVIIKVCCIQNHVITVLFIAVMLGIGFSVNFVLLKKNKVFQSSMIHPIKVYPNITKCTNAGKSKHCHIASGSLPISMKLPRYTSNSQRR